MDKHDYIKNPAPGYAPGIIPNRLDPINLKKAQEEYPRVFGGMDADQYDKLRMAMTGRESGFEGRRVGGLK